ncbi:DUF7059 domain-containing protein [Vallicoccus soli]|uniref:DUF7059 domain-containing protein n=1 Tax=Vallicoccus soli TaxID=2339232 RepID=UPI003CCC7E99
MAVGYDADGVAELLGPVAQRALARSETVPARRATAGGSALEQLVRLWLLQLPVPEEAVAEALPVEAALRLGLVARDGASLRARLDVRPYDEGFLVVSDLGTGLDGEVSPLPADHVLGVGGASTSLAELTVRPPVGRALDLGTGCGVQALHLSGHAREVVATDVLPRAVRLARLTAALSGVELDVREGSWFAPVRGERFDLVVSNPPFVVGGTAGGGERTYRDGGEAGDALCARLVREAPAHLTEGGWCQLLANWVHRRGEDWRERVGGWLPEGCDAWALQREVLDPAEYVSLWLHDAGDAAGPRYRDLYDAWLGALERDGVEGVGFGWVSLRRVDAAAPQRRVEDWPHAVEAPLGPHVLDAFGRWEWLRGHAADLLGQRLRVADGVVQEQVGPPGAEDPEHLVLRQQGGLRRAERVGTAAAGLVGACDGTVPLGVLVEAVAAVLDEDAEGLRASVLPVVRTLVADGTLVPA